MWFCGKAKLHGFLCYGLCPRGQQQILQVHGSEWAKTGIDEIKSSK